MLSFNIFDILIQKNVAFVNNIIYGTSITDYLVACSGDLPESVNLRFDHNNWITSNGFGREEFYFEGNNYHLC